MSDVTCHPERSEGSAADERWSAGSGDPSPSARLAMTRGMSAGRFFGIGSRMRFFAVSAAQNDGRRIREVFLLLRMLFWTVVISIAARLLPLPKALGIIAPRRRATLSMPPAR